MKPDAKREAFVGGHQKSVSVCGGDGRMILLVLFFTFCQPPWFLYVYLGKTSEIANGVCSTLKAWVAVPKPREMHTCILMALQHLVDQLCCTTALTLNFQPSSSLKKPFPIQPQGTTSGEL